MGRGGRGAGFSRGGGVSRSGGGGVRSGGIGRSLGGSAGRPGRGAGATAPKPAPRVSAPRPVVPRARSGGLGNAASFGLGLGTGMAMGGRRRRFGFGPSWGFGSRRRMTGGPGMGRSGCSGCSSIIMVVVVLILLISIISFINNWGPTGNQPTQQVVHITQTTRVRSPLPRGAVNDVGPLYTDNLGWIQNSAQMQEGLRAFFNATGVRPHVYITDSINGNNSPTPSEVMEYAGILYDQLFRDEGHLLMVFFEYGIFPNNQIEIALQPGSQARLVMDDESQNILLDYLAFYNDQFHLTFDFHAEQVFSNAFADAAERIMFRPPNNRPIWITLIIVTGVVLVVLVSYNFWKQKQIQKNLEAEQTERILNQDLGTFADDEATRLAKQYEDN